MTREYPLHTPQGHMTTFLMSVKMTSGPTHRQVTALIEDEHRRRREYRRVFHLLEGERAAALEARVMSFKQAIQSGPFGNAGPTYLPNYLEAEDAFNRIADELEEMAREELLVSQERAAQQAIPPPSHKEDFGDPQGLDVPADIPDTSFSTPPTKDSAMDKMKKVGADVIDAGKMAAGLTAAAKTRRAAVDLLLAGAVKAGMLEAEQAQDERIKMAVGVLLPGVIMLAAEYAPDAIPKTDAVAVGAKYALVGAQAEVMDLLLPEVLPLIEMFAALAFSNFADEVPALGEPKALEAAADPQVAELVSGTGSARVHAATKAS